MLLRTFGYHPKDLITHTVVRPRRLAGRSARKQENRRGECHGEFDEQNREGHHSCVPLVVIHTIMFPVSFIPPQSQTWCWTVLAIITFCSANHQVHW